MPKIVLQASSTAEWKELISQAQSQCPHELDVHLESYLVFLLMRFTNEPGLAESLLALDYLCSQQKHGPSRRDELRDVGDKCLLMAGLFPGNARARLVTPSYFVNLGRCAYSQLSDLEIKSISELYEHLAAKFTHLIEVLQATRIVAGIEEQVDMLDAYDLWQSSGSEFAKNRLEKHTYSSTIITPDLSNKSKLH